MRDPMYQQGNQSPPYHNQGQQFSLSEDNYEQAKEATDFSFHAFLNFDGASKGNPGLAGAGAVLRAVDGSVVYRLREGLGFATNNVAEFRGVILGLKYALQKGFKHIQVQGDSKLVCMQELNTEADMLANLAVLLNRMLAFADGETQVEST